jgi:hypothetical protein
MRPGAGYRIRANFAGFRPAGLATAPAEGRLTGHTHSPTMKNSLSFKLLAITILAGVVLAVVNPGHSDETLNADAGHNGAATAETSNGSP